jgi:hypothetical protein
MKLKKSKTSKNHKKWVISITLAAFFLSVFMSFFSGVLLDNTGRFISFIILICIIFLGILFDLIGVAVTVADERPFHSMASAKVKSAPSSIKLIRNASKVSNFCNDVIGDICGIISGTSAAFIIVKMQADYPTFDMAIVSIVLSGLIASLTIGGKAIGKEIAMNHAKEIVTAAGKVLFLFGNK